MKKPKLTPIKILKKNGEYTTDKKLSKNASYLIYACRKWHTCDAYYSTTMGWTFYGEYDLFLNSEHPDLQIKAIYIIK